MAEIIDVVMRLTDNVTDGLQRIRSEMEQTSKANMQMGRNLSNASRNVGNLASSMMPLAAGIAGAGAIGVKTFMDFDSVITGAGVKAGATSEEMQKMKDAAAQMGAKFPTTAREVAEGMDRLAAGGFDAEQTIGAMPGIIEASIASGEDMATTSDVVTSALSIWNMKNGDIAASTTHVADVVQAAANASKLGMADFGLAMQYAGAPAAALGINIEELGTAMGIMSNNGIEASTIGTSLRATLSRLADPPKTTAMAFDQLGISMSDLQKGDGSFIGLTGAVDLLRSKMAGLSDTQQVAIAKAVAGEDAYSGLLALIKTSPEAYQQMSDAITNSAGSSHEAYVKMQNTLKGSVDALKSSLEALGISFGSAMAPSIKSAAESIKALVDGFNSLSPEAKSLVIHIGEGIVAFTGLAFATSKVLSITGTAITTYGQIGRVLAGHSIRNKGLQYAVMGVAKALPILKSGILSLASGFRVALAAMGPMGILFMALGIAAAYVISHWEQFAPIVQSIGAAVMNNIQWVWNGLKGFFSSLVQIATSIINFFRGVFVGAWNIICNLVVAAFNNVWTGIQVVGNGIQNVLEMWVNMVMGVFDGLIEFITGVFTGDWSAAWQGVVDIFSSIFGGIKGIADGILEGIKAAINAVIDGINSISVDIPDWVPHFGGRHFGLNIPHLYTGTTNWMGGPAVINDAGAEIVDLPSGTRVIPHDQSINQAYNMGRAGSGTGGAKITINIGTANMGSNQDIRQQARMLAEQILFELETRAINQNVGAI
jgi:TP901 family phage tail tape measure protein